MTIDAHSLSYSHDANGNRTGDGSQTWTYGGNATTFLINALGQRVKKTTAGIGTRLTETVWFNDLPVAVMP